MVEAGKRLTSVNLQPFLLGLGFALLIAISAGSAVLVRQAQTDSQLRAQSLTIQDRLSDILLDMRRAESGQRGYLLTGEPKYLDDFTAAEPSVLRTIRELFDLLTDKPARRAQLDNIARQVDGKLDELRKTITLERAGQSQAARDEVRTDRGRELMEAIRELTTAAIADEQATINLRTQQSARTNTLLLWVSLAGAALIVVIGGLSVALVRRNAGRAEAARRELEGTNNNLERIVEFRTADLTEANNEIQRFAYIVSHNLRSPLVNIMGFTSELETLRKDIFEHLATLAAEVARLNGQADPADGKVAQFGAEFDEAIRFIKSSIGNMDRLINAVLKLSREGRREFHPQVIDMTALLGQIKDTVSHRVTELGAVLDVSDLPPIESDPLALEQIFTNLVDNALKYRQLDRPLTIRVTGRTQSGDARFDVEDNGRGIDPADHQRVFELFRRSGKQDRPGEGIGLAHVRALVRRLGGTMELKSALGKGSTFTVILPLQWSVNARSAA